MSLDRAAYPSDVSDEEWALVAPYLALLREDSKQRDHELREGFNGLRYIVKTGHPGGSCRTTCRLGRRSTSRYTAGWPQSASRTWPVTCARCCGWRGVGGRRRLR